jgi:hypothetical protein
MAVVKNTAVGVEQRVISSGIVIILSYQQQAFNVNVYPKSKESCPKEPCFGFTPKECD